MDIARTVWYGLLSSVLAVIIGCSAQHRAEVRVDEPMEGDEAQELSPLEQLGKFIFFDPSLSSPPGQSCATCHHPVIGWTGPDPQINLLTAVYPGAVSSRFGNRRPPSSAYAGYSPVLHYDDEEGIYIGGLFWDGRATGERLGDPLAEQAQGPFVNPVEQNFADHKELCRAVANASYADLFARVFPGLKSPLDCMHDSEIIYDKIARAIAAFERSSEVDPFSSKYDHYLRTCMAAGNAPGTCAEGKGEKEVLDPGNIFNSQEWEGLTLFVGENDNDGIREPGEGGLCFKCHVVDWITDDEGEQVPPIFTDHTYDNIGSPRNLLNPFYDMPPDINPKGKDWIDLGLGAYLETRADHAHRAQEQYGKVRVPTLRNVDKRPTPWFTKSFGHNGYFKSLELIVHFYNTRDMLPVCEGNSYSQGIECWPEPETVMNINREELGKLALTVEEERAIVAFMRTLSDGYSEGEQ